MTAHHNARAAATLMGALVAGGVRAVVFSPGSRSTPLVLAALAHPEVVTHPVLDERAAGFLALGLARAGRRPVALLCTSGSAGAHWLPAVVEARQDRVPLLLLTADRPPELVGSGAGQTIDQKGLFGAFVVHEAHLPAPDAAVPPAVFGAFADDALLACEAGPVHLNAPFREPLWHPEADYAPPPPRLPPHRGNPREINGLDALRSAAAPARRGLVYCGPGAHPPANVTALGWPVLVEAASGGRFGPGIGEGRIAAYEALARSSFAASHTPDLVLHFGGAPHARAVQAWLAGVPTLAVDPHGDRRDPAHQAIGRWRATAEAAVDALVGHTSAATGWLAAWVEADRRARAALDAACGEGVWEGAVVQALVDALPDGGALHVASSMPYRDLDAFSPVTSRNIKVFANRGASGIDGTVACALGEALALGAPTVAFLGDLALLHDAGGLLLAGEHRDAVNLTLVVADNGGGGIFEYLPIRGIAPGAFERAFLTPQQADLAALSAAARIRHQRVTHSNALQPALDAALRRPGVDVIQVVIERAESVARHQAAWAAAAEGVR